MYIFHENLKMNPFKSMKRTHFLLVYVDYIRNTTILTNSYNGDELFIYTRTNYTLTNLFNNPNQLELYQNSYIIFVTINNPPQAHYCVRELSLSLILNYF